VSHSQAVAEILGMYTDFEIYFLARDGEYFYDVARILTHCTPSPSGPPAPWCVDAEQAKKDADRIHLINVSRGTVADPHLKEYIEQEGISEELLQKPNLKLS
jgi:hypothetical protein